MKGTVIGHVFLWLVVIPLLSMAIVPLFHVHGQPAVSPREVTSFANQGIDVDQAQAVATASFTHRFIDSGLISRSYAWIAPSRSPRALDQTRLRVTTWVEGAWSAVYRAQFRYSAYGKSLSVFVLIGLIAAIVDGLGVRARKRFEFGYQNPVTFSLARHAPILLLGAFLVGPFWPFALTPEWLMGGFAFMAFVTWIAAANFQAG